MTAIDSTVLIVGAGPAGLVLALDLVKHGLNVRIIEKTEALFIGQRGAGIMPRSIELYRSLGVLPDIQQIAIPTPSVKLCKVGEGDSSVLAVSAMCPYIEPTPSCPYFNPILLGQGRVQCILASHLEKYGCHVETGTELRGFEQHKDHVACHLRNTTVDGVVTEEEVKAAYVVGADGTRGVVRKLLGLSFLGETRTGEHWVIADVKIKGIDIDTDFWHAWGDFNQGLLAIRPTDRRDEGEFWIAIAGHNIDLDILSTDQAEFANLVRKLSGFESLEITDFMTLNYYRINIRMVDQFGKGRVFVAGDAAHTHSFTGAQGMNSSIQDSYNLGWKLSLVANSLASPTLLDSYTSERLPVIADVLGKTTELLKKALIRDPTKNVGDSWFRGPEMYQLNVNYRGSPIVFDELELDEVEGVTRLRAGDRAPDAPWLVGVTKGLGATQLFDLFEPTRHIALIFPLMDSDVVSFIDALSTYPTGTVTTVVVLPKGSVLVERNSQWGADSVVLDDNEHAWKAYPTAEGGNVVIVRPDGYVGAISKTVKGVTSYKELIFNVSA